MQIWNVQQINVLRTSSVLQCDLGVLVEGFHGEPYTGCAIASHSQVITQLHSSSLPEEQLGLLRPLHQRGAKETKKQRLRRALKLQRAGLTDFEGAEELLQPRKVRGVGVAAAGSGSSSSDDVSSGSESGEDEAAPPAAAAAEDGKSEICAEEGEDSERPAKQAKLGEGAVGQQQQQQHQLNSAVGIAQQKAQLAALRAEAKALKVQAKAQAAAEGTGAAQQAFKLRLDVGVVCTAREGPATSRRVRYDHSGIVQPEGQ
jgi:hypothetical protein